MADVLVCRSDDLADGQVRIVMVDDAEIAVIRHKGEWFAYRNLCPHQGGPACEGVMMAATKELIAEGGVSLGHTFDEEEMHIVCPWHGYEFRLSDGRHARDNRVRLQKFAVAQRDGDVYVSI